MSDVVVSTVIGVVGTGLIGMFFMQLQNLREDLRQGFRQQGDSIKSLEASVVALGASVAQLNETAKDHSQRLARIEIEHGERLARIEAKLDIDPPAEAA